MSAPTDASVALTMLGDYIGTVYVSDTAAAKVRLRNERPEHNTKVDTINVLAGALISACEEMADDRVGEKYDGRAASIAITHAESAAMYAVKAATLR